ACRSSRLIASISDVTLCSLAWLVTAAHRHVANNTNGQRTANDTLFSATSQTQSARTVSNTVDLHSSLFEKSEAEVHHGRVGTARHHLAALQLSAATADERHRQIAVSVLVAIA